MYDFTLDVIRSYGFTFNKAKEVRSLEEEGLESNINPEDINELVVQEKRLDKDLKSNERSNVMFRSILQHV